MSQTLNQMGGNINWSFFRLIFILFAVGVFMELILIEHYEDPKQLIPVVFIPLSLLFFVLTYFFPGKWIKRITTTIMSLCALAGLLGIFFHLQGNFEFEKEMYPTMSPGNLFVKSLKGATPLLAPGSLIGFGLLGVFYSISRKI